MEPGFWCLTSICVYLSRAESLSVMLIHTVLMQYSIIQRRSLGLYTAEAPVQNTVCCFEVQEPKQ